MKTIKFRNDRVVDFFKKEFKEQADRAMAEAAVVDLYRRKQISGPLGAELLGLHLTEFAEALALSGVPYFSEPLQDEHESFTRWQAQREQGA